MQLISVIIMMENFDKVLKDELVITASAISILTIR